MSIHAVDRNLIDLVKEAVRRTVAVMRKLHPDESLVGYALCTDDGLETLLCMVVTDTAIASSTDPDLLYTPTDWPYEPEPTVLDRANEYLRTLGAAASGLRAHVDEAFASLVVALAELRAEGLFEPSVFLSALSTDPSDYLETLETESVATLNAPDIVTGRDQFLLKWA